MNSPHWTAYLSALLTPIIGFFAVYVAVSQWTTARNKLRFDLFEKRFAVYESARRFLGSVMSSGTVSGEAMSAYLQGTQAAKWIVAQEIHDFLDREIYHPAVELQCLDAELEGLPSASERSAVVSRRSEIRKHLHQQIEQLDVWFRSYLLLEH